MIGVLMAVIDARSGRGARRGRFALGLGLALATMSLAAPGAGAQACDPVYGCDPSTTIPESTPPTCSLDATSAGAGEVVVASVDHAPAHAAIQITVAGVAAAGGVADGAGHAEIAFSLPASIDPGAHEVFAIGAGLSASCGPLSADLVLGQVVTPGPEVSAGGGSRGGGALARTGIEVALLLPIAAALLLVGGWFVARERRRRRRLSRRRNAIVNLAEEPLDLHRS
jgi:hypothetical protein